MTGVKAKTEPPKANPQISNGFGDFKPFEKDMLRRISFFDITVVLVVAEVGSFRKAGIALQMGQSAVSRRLQKIEDDIGVSLFERSVNGARLTPAGWRFSVCARTIIRDFRLAINTARSAGTAWLGQLDIGVCASLSAGALKEIVSAFMARHPDVALFISDSPADELLTMLVQRRIDAVVALGVFREEQGDSVVVENQRIYVALPENHPLAKQRHVDWQDLVDETFLIGHAGLESSLHKKIIFGFSNAYARPRIVRHNIGREALMNMVGLGFGVSVTTEQWAANSYPNVAFRALAGHSASIPLSLIWRPENDNPALRRFVSLARIEAKRNGALSASSQTPDPSP